MINHESPNSGKNHKNSFQGPFITIDHVQLFQTLLFNSCVCLLCAGFCCSFQEPYGSLCTFGEQRPRDKAVQSEAIALVKIELLPKEGGREESSREEKVNSPNPIKRSSMFLWTAGRD